MMEIVLPNGRKTDQLAFGCGGLGGSLDYAASRKLLAAAWDAGFRHFDVAPSYGLGEAEGYLGRFLKEIGARDATITTKVGIARPTPSSGPKKLLLSVARPILNQVPALRKKLGNRMRQGAARGQFSAAFVEASLEQSLKALGVDHIDIFLLHEFTKDDMSDELLTVLERARRAGKIGSVGIGSRRERMTELMDIPAGLITYFQTAWDFDDPRLPRPSHGTSNCHGVLRQMARLDAVLEGQSGKRQQLEEAVGTSLQEPLAKSDLLLAMALADVGNGLVVAQSSKVQRIADLRLDRRLADPKRVGLVANELLRT